MHTTKSNTTLLICLLAVIGLTLLPGLSLAQDAMPTVDRTSIILADVDDDPLKKIKRFQPLADYLALHLESYGIEVGEVQIAPDMDTMMGWLEDGEIDLYFDSPFPVMMIAEEIGAQPVLRRWKDGVSEYHTIFFTADNSGITSLEDLQGQIIAFDAPNSTSGYMLPKAYLMDMGFYVEEKAQPTSRVADDEIGYVFSHDDDTTMQWVISGRVIAGVVDNESFAELPAETRERMVILGETPAVPRQMMVARPEFDPEVLAAISEILTTMHETAEGQAVLEAFKTSQFDEFPEGAEAALADLQSMYDMVTE